MFSHFTLGSTNISRSADFYDAVMSSLGQKLIAEEKDAYRMYGPPDGDFPHLFVVYPLDGLTCHLEQRFSYCLSCTE